MPDSLTNIEMNDVLSSIRRLVSEETAKNTQPKAVVPDRFVLTPALRVEELPTADAAVQTLDGPLIQAPIQDPDTLEQQELTKVLATAAAVTSVQSAADAQTESSESGAVETEEKSSAEFEAMEQAWKNELAHIANARQDSQVQNAAAEQDPQTPPQSLELRIAELEEAVGQSDNEWEPDGSEPEANQHPRRHIFEVVDNTRNGAPENAQSGAADPDVEADIPEAETPDVDPAEEAMPVFSHSREPRPRPYLLSGGIETVGAGETVGTDAYTPEPFEPEPITPELFDPEIEDAAAHLPEDQVPVDQGLADVVEDDDVFLDVEALRTMVTDVVREELRGKLGESITRNVRRMMQQEIAQAITLADLEEDDRG